MQAERETSLSGLRESEFEGFIFRPTPSLAKPHLEQEFLGIQWTGTKLRGHNCNASRSGIFSQSSVGLFTNFKTKSSKGYLLTMIERIAAI